MSKTPKFSFKLSPEQIRIIVNGVKPVQNEDNLVISVSKDGNINIVTEDGGTVTDITVPSLTTDTTNLPEGEMATFTYSKDRIKEIFGKVIDYVTIKVHDNEVVFEVDGTNIVMALTPLDIIVNTSFNKSSFETMQAPDLKSICNRIGVNYRNGSPIATLQIGPSFKFGCSESFMITKDGTQKLQTQVSHEFFRYLNNATNLGAANIELALDDEKGNLKVTADGVSYITKTIDVDFPQLPDDEDLYSNNSASAKLSGKTITQSLNKLLIPLNTLSKDADKVFTLKLDDDEEKALVTVKDSGGKISKDNWSQVDAKGKQEIDANVYNFLGTVSVMQDTVELRTAEAGETPIFTISDENTTAYLVVYM